MMEMWKLFLLGFLNTPLPLSGSTIHVYLLLIISVGEHIRDEIRPALSAGKKVMLPQDRIAAFALAVLADMPVARWEIGCFPLQPAHRFSFRVLFFNTFLMDFFALFCHDFFRFV
jgi:hypothetical protein